MKELITYSRMTIISLIIITSLTKTYAQNNLPAKSYWIVEDDYGRKVNTGVVKERYNEDSNGNIHGKYLQYDKSGKRFINANFTHGKLYGAYDGTMGFYLKNVSKFKRSTDGPLYGAMDGKMLDKVFAKTTINENLLFDGPTEIQYSISFFMTLHVVETGEFENGQKVGEWRECDNDGCWVGAYKAGKKEGSWVYDNPKGDISKIDKEKRVIKRVGFPILELLWSRENPFFSNKISYCYYYYGC